MCPACCLGLQSLLSVPGVDMVQFGPSDYAMSMGVTGQGGNHPIVKEGEIKTVRYRPTDAL